MPNYSASKPFVPPPQFAKQSMMAQQMEQALLSDVGDNDDVDPVQRFLSSLSEETKATSTDSPALPNREDSSLNARIDFTTETQG